MPCGCQGANQNRQTFRTPAARAATDSQRAAQAAVGTMYEVLTARGATTGRKFSSLVAATNYARNINGSTRPA